MIPTLAAGAAVLLYVLAFAPAEVGALAFLALAPWCALARRFQGGRLFLAGTLVGAAILTFGCAWLAKAHPMNLVLMVVPESLFFGGFALLLRALLVTRSLPATLALPLAFTTIECWRGRWPLDGFPWLSLGYSQYRWLGFVQVADLVGVHGITFVLALVAGAVVDTWDRRGRPRSWTRLVPAAAVVSACCVYGWIRLSSPEEQPPGPRMLIVQPDIPQGLKGHAESEGEILARHFKLMDRFARESPGGVDVVAWSESFLPLLGLPAEDDPKLIPLEREWIRKVVGPRLDRFGAQFLTGAVTYVEPGDHLAGIYNSALLYGRDGRRLALYHKRICVPGGEYLPWIGHFPESVQREIKERVLDMAGFVPMLLPGKRLGLFTLGEGERATPAGITICFEIAYPELGRELVKAGARFLVNLSNEAWFPDSAEFDQYTAMAVVRAAELKRSVVRVANSGTSGWIDPSGRRHLLEQDGKRSGFPAIAVVQPLLSDETTLYARVGEWVGIAAAAASLLLLVLRRGRRAGAAAGGKAGVAT